jgi:hypothetical protein
MRFSRAWVGIGAVLGALIVIGSMIATHPGWGFVSHADCQIGDDLGNITVWNTAAVIAAPYLGFEIGSVTIWGRTPGGTFSASQGTNVTNGNVTAYWVSFSNFTVFARHTVTVSGIGPEAPCATPMVAFFSSVPAQGLRSGGTSWTTVASGQVSDVSLPTSLNGSQLCAEVENTSYSGCAVGAQFNIDFVRATGTVDTCGSSQPEVLPFHTDGWPVTAPFEQDGQSYNIPLDPAGTDSADYANGTYAWYNYTFPANEGIWQYDNLLETSSTGEGLVFQYSPCP